MLLKQPKFRQLKRVFQPAGTITRAKINRITLHLTRLDRQHYIAKRNDKTTTKYIDQAAQDYLTHLQGTNP